MGKKINMPKLAPEMESGVLCAWLKEEGDTVCVDTAVRWWKRSKTWKRNRNG